MPPRKFRPALLPCVDRMDSALSSPVAGPADSLLCEGYAAAPGIATYTLRDSKGKAVTARILSDRDALWAQDSIETLGRAPITLGHPDVFVDEENAKELIEGDLDGDIVEEPANSYVRVKLAVRTKDAKDALQNGTCQLSCGYVAAMDWTPGVHPEFGAYDGRQIKRRYNHLAIVDEARWGPDMRVMLDGKRAAVGDIQTAPEADEAPVNIFTLLTDAADLRGRIAEFKDSIGLRLQVNKAVSDYYDAMWPTYRALCEALEAAVKMDDEAARVAEVERICAELRDVHAKITAKFAESATGEGAAVEPAAVTAVLDEAPVETEPAAPLAVESLDDKLAALIARVAVLEARPIATIDAAPVQVATPQPIGYADIKMVDGYLTGQSIPCTDAKPEDILAKAREHLGLDGNVSDEALVAAVRVIARDSATVARPTPQRANYPSLKPAGSGYKTQ